MPGSPEFKLPPNAEAYISQIRSRARKLIEADIWDGIELVRVERWLKNFTTTEEKYFAARILDSLIYRSKRQTLALVDQLFFRCIPEVLNKVGNNDVTNWVSALKSNKDSQIRIVPVIRDDDPPTKSGPLVARIIKRHLRLNDKWMVWPFKLEEELEKGVDKFLFIDDFLGTGKQFDKFTKRNNLKDLFDNQLCIYAPLAASTTGVEKLNQDYPSLNVTTSELLQKNMHLFSDESDCFYDNVNTPQDVKYFYEQLLYKISGIEPENNDFTYGFGHLGMAYAFDHASPNASIPLLWYEYENFTPLFDR